MGVNVSMGTVLFDNILIKKSSILKCVNKMAHTMKQC